MLPGQIRAQILHRQLLNLQNASIFGRVNRPVNLPNRERSIFVADGENVEFRVIVCRRHGRVALSFLIHVILESPPIFDAFQIFFV